MLQHGTRIGATAIYMQRAGVVDFVRERRVGRADAGAEPDDHVAAGCRRLASAACAKQVQRATMQHATCQHSTMQHAPCKHRQRVCAADCSSAHRRIGSLQPLAPSECPIGSNSCLRAKPTGNRTYSEQILDRPPTLLTGAHTAACRLVLFRGDLLHGVLPALRDEIARTGHKYRVTLLAGFAFRACASLQWALQRIDPTHNCTVRCRAPPADHSAAGLQTD
jgi:hypothetical protein